MTELGPPLTQTGFDVPLVRMAIQHAQVRAEGVEARGHIRHELAAVVAQHPQTGCYVLNVEARLPVALIARDEIGIKIPGELMQPVPRKPNGSPAN